MRISYFQLALHVPTIIDRKLDYQRIEIRADFSNCSHHRSTTNNNNNHDEYNTNSLILQLCFHQGLHELSPFPCTNLVSCLASEEGSSSEHAKCFHLLQGSCWQEANEKKEVATDEILVRS